MLPTFVIITKHLQSALAIFSVCFFFLPFNKVIKDSKLFGMKKDKKTCTLITISTKKKKKNIYLSNKNSTNKYGKN